MKTRFLHLKLQASALSIATAPGPVFAMLDPPGVADFHGDTMDAGGLELPPPGENGLSEVPLYYLHSYHEDVVMEAAPADRVAIGAAVVWMEDGQPYFTPRFFGNTELSEETQRRLEAGEISACSVGYLVKRCTPNGKGPDGTGEDVHKARLIEVSLVDKGAKEGAVRIKAMNEEQIKKLEKMVMTLRSDMAQIKTKSMGVEMMCGSSAMYFATELMEHLAESVAACQTYLSQENPEPALANIAKQLATSTGTTLMDLASWLSSGAPRGEAQPASAQQQMPATASATEEQASGEAVTKWWQSFAKRTAA